MSKAEDLFPEGAQRLLQNPKAPSWGRREMGSLRNFEIQREVIEMPPLSQATDGGD